jgi:hypothetical protein
VPDEHRGAYDLIANLGSTEHIFDQVNVFRCIHDFAKVGGIFWHSVPAVGYYNHKYNYHPLFFVFLARANEYCIEAAGLSQPHFAFTIPPFGCAVRQRSLGRHQAIQRHDLVCHEEDPSSCLPITIAA